MTESKPTNENTSEEEKKQVNNDIVYHYRTDIARPFLDKRKIELIQKANWITRLTFNATLNYNQSYYHTAKLRNDLRHYNDKTSLSYFDLCQDLTQARKDPDMGNDLSFLPVTTLRVPMQQAKIAISASIKKWMKGEKASYPRFRSVNDAQEVRFSVLPEYEINKKHLSLKLKGWGRIKVRIHRQPP